MAKIDIILDNFENFKGYEGNAPTNETEYNAMKDNAFEGTAPTWSEEQNETR
jgi:hypothetical protein